MASIVSRLTSRVMKTIRERWSSEGQEALLSTLAGNLLILGSLANIIVVERARAVGVRLGFLEHARCGIPMTAFSLGFACAWLWATGLMPLK